MYNYGYSGSCMVRSWVYIDTNSNRGAAAQQGNEMVPVLSRHSELHRSRLWAFDATRVGVQLDHANAKIPPSKLGGGSGATRGSSSRIVRYGQNSSFFGCSAMAKNTEYSSFTMCGAQKIERVNFRAVV